ncbi:transcriptional regulator [Campylobacter pinnipediorum subsp. pinnipediorum]|uniref:Transcriptional regulator n=1 Tax=Campylobacter pinnipediorum subsp. pinnipediorum TaxID=1660067 RepID=A0AAX0LAH6_9BACT|nr:transglutaminase family protein [Campylobacter pinnipediorum]OPA77894.1 transcriptional regulator [Campylobacter pinnipediorum subsp. pinnipediorum]
MKRRDFFKFGSILGATCAISSVATAKSDIKSKQNRTFNINLKHFIKEKSIDQRLWVPLVTNTDYQQITSLYDINTNSKDYYMSDFEIPTLYAKFDDKDRNFNLDISFSVQTQDRNTDFSKVNFNENEKLSPEIEKFLKPTTQIPVDGVVFEKAKQIVGNIKGDLEKAKAIYTWVANTMQRDNSVIGCGRGDIKAILETGKLVGKCTDINSVFVGLCRAVGIPAREFFGIRVGQSKTSNQMGKADKNGFADITGAQHCRAEFYLKGYGWIPVDPADVTKVRLGENLDNNDARIGQIRDYLFGNWEMCWIGFNYGRDFILKPQPEQYPINNFGYPYAELEGNVVDYYSSKDFSYKYTSQEILI